jgi:hypothetical protein
VADRTVAALYLPRVENPLGVRVVNRAIRRKSKIIEADIDLLYSLPQTRDETLKRDVLLVGVCADSAGHRTEVFRVPTEGSVTPTPEGPSLSARIRLRMDPGTRVVSLGIQDVATGIVSYVRFSLAP